MLKTKPLEKVTVTDIVNNADINRGTFYAHYTDICELIHAVEDEIVDTLCSFTHEWNETEPFQNPLPLFLRISDYLTQKQDLIFALMNANNTSSFVFRLPDLLTEHLLASDSVSKPLLRDPLLEARFRFYAGVLSAYMQHGFKARWKERLTMLHICLKKLSSINPSAIAGLVFHNMLSFAAPTVSGRNFAGQKLSTVLLICTFLLPLSTKRNLFVFANPENLRSGTI